ncbi:hypothetical protein [Paenibacillus sp. 1A_MP2]
MARDRCERRAGDVLVATADRWLIDRFDGDLVMTSGDCRSIMAK